MYYSMIFIRFYYLVSIIFLAFVSIWHISHANANSSKPVFEQIRMILIVVKVEQNLLYEKKLLYGVVSCRSFICCVLQHLTICAETCSHMIKKNGHLQYNIFTLSFIKRMRLKGGLRRNNWHLKSSFVVCTKLKLTRTSVHAEQFSEVPFTYYYLFKGEKFHQSYSACLYVTWLKERHTYHQLSKTIFHLHPFLCLLYNAAIWTSYCWAHGSTFANLFCNISWVTNFMWQVVKIKHVLLNVVPLLLLPKRLWHDLIWLCVISSH